jgi:hypothetical protein
MQRPQQRCRPVLLWTASRVLCWRETMQKGTLLQMGSCIVSLLRRLCRKAVNYLCSRSCKHRRLCQATALHPHWKMSQ